VSRSPNPISIDISRAFASPADPLIATRDTRHGAYDPHDATASSPTSPVDGSPPRSSTAGVWSRASATSRHARVFFARDAAGFFNSRRAGCAPRRATRAARATAAGSPPPDTRPRSRASRHRDRAVVGSSADGRSADGESERSKSAQAHSVVDRDAFAFLRPPVRTRR
jgi:hypothetical protein